MGPKNLSPPPTLRRLALPSEDTELASSAPVMAMLGLQTLLPGTRFFHAIRCMCRIVRYAGAAGLEPGYVLGVCCVAVSHPGR